MAKPSYSLAAWRRLRANHLARNPWCVYCWQGRCACARKSLVPIQTPYALSPLGTRERYPGPCYCITAANVVDHIIPHLGVWTLFLDAANLQSLCKPCHDTVKRTEDHACAVDEKGYPIEVKHGT
jgi:5-methylcytosine-specific restriction endonuclease McrA